MNREEIKKILPHREPMLLVDEAYVNENGELFSEEEKKELELTKEQKKELKRKEKELKEAAKEATKREKQKNKISWIDKIIEFSESVKEGIEKDQV